MMITQFYAVVDVAGALIGAAQDNGVDMQPDGGELEWTQLGAGDGFGVQSVDGVTYYEGNGSSSDSPVKLYAGDGTSSVDLEVVAQGIRHSSRSIRLPPVPMEG